MTGLGLTRAVGGFSALPAVRDELEGILKHAGVRGEAHFDEAFTAERLREALTQRVPLVHVASHFKFNPGTEVDSFLVLGDGKRLTLRELREAGYNFRGVDLLTLSACETAVGGGADANGREVEGFGALAQQRGARAVMATLWLVADQSTGLLMQNFYRLRAQGGDMNKAEALQQAQLALLQGNHAQTQTSSKAERGLERTATPAGERYNADAKAPYAHPYFWAPFILMGNWL
jgi:CHAT domain-containing protein